MTASPAPTSVTAPVVSFTVATLALDDVYFTPSRPSGVTVSVGASNSAPIVAVAVSFENFSVGVALVMVKVLMAYPVQRNLPVTSANGAFWSVAAPGSMLSCHDTV